MKSDDIVFADRILNIAITGTIVRMDLGVMQPSEDKNKQPMFIQTKTVVVPIEGFVNAYGMMEQVINRLVEAGAITKRDPKNGLATAKEKPTKTN